MAEALNPQGQIKVFWVTSTLTTSAPTAAQINAGLDLTDAILQDGIAGFARAPQYVDATSIGDTAEETVPGLATTTNGELTLKRGTAGSDNSDLLTALQEDLNTEGHVVFVLGTVATGTLVDIYPSTLASVNPQSPAGGQIMRYIVGFSHQGQFVINEAIAS